MRARQVLAYEAERRRAAPAARILAMHSTC